VFRIHEKYARIIGIPTLGIFLAFLFCPDDFPKLGGVLKTITFVFIFWQGTFSIITLFRNKFPKIKQTTKRILFSFLAVSIYIIIADALMRLFFDHFYPELDWGVKSLPLNLLKNFFISILVAMVYELTYFYGRWNQANLETEQLKTQNIASQLESLKNQISPHFLFNSLNTLAAIIPENHEQAVRFTEKLSEVYRYILQYKNRELVELKTELEFIESYLFLLKIRYPENLFVEFSINQQHKKKHVAPLTLQILVENCIKHNVISKSDPLTVKIYTDKGGNIVVENKLLLKTIAKNSTKTGLENIKKRYQYLTDESVEIVDNSANFIVSVPLIDFNQT
jgi:two-component system LytT family sensor kinase